MNFDKKKYSYIAIVTVLAVITLYVTYILIKDGHPTEKSQNEYLIKANDLHNDSLYEEAVESYMRAFGFNKQQSLVNYNVATNLLKKNHKLLSRAFNEEKYKLDSTVVTALNDAESKLVDAAKTQEDSEKYSLIYHNIGVGKHMQDSLEIAAEAYKEALRKNPYNEDARYNLAVILYQMKQDGQQGGGQGQQPQNQENNGNEEENQDQQQEQQEQQQEQQENTEEKQDEQEEQQQQKEQDEELEKIEQMLNALLQDEKEIMEKLEESEKKKEKKVKKNW